MKLKKLIPITGLSTIVASIAPIGLSSCSKYQYIDILNGYTPKTESIPERQFNDYSEVCNYYRQLNKDILSEDFLWSLGEYVKENLEFPEPVFPFKFKQIEKAIITLEDWWSQEYPDSTRKDLFISSYSINFKISGTTEPRQNYSGPVGEYIPNSNVVCSLTMHVYKMPYTIINKNVGTNKTDARWIVKPAPADVLLADTTWNISDVVEINYIYQAQLEHSVTTTDSLSVYVHNTNLSEVEKQKDVSNLYQFSKDALTYGSYHLKNCTLKV